MDESMVGEKKLLFTKDDWSIYLADYAKAGLGGSIMAYAHHQGCTSSVLEGNPTNCWHPGDFKQKCVLCRVDVPDGIQALITLYQWSCNDG